MANTTTLPYSHDWSEMYKGIDGNGPYYRCSFLFIDPSNNGTYWAQSDSIANQMMGKSTLTGGKSSYVGPYPHPLSTNLCCVQCNIEGVGSPVLNANGLPNYLGGFVAHCEFRPFPWGGGTISDAVMQGIDPATPVLWCIQEIDFETERITSKDNQYVWGLTNKPAAVDLTFELHNTVLRLNFPRLPYIPMTAVRNLRGKVNNATFFGSARGTVLFRGGRSHREFNTDGSVVQSIDLVFVERSKPWNQYLMPDGFTWSTVYDSDGNTYYQEDDLSQLISL